MTKPQSRELVRLYDDFTLSVAPTFRKTFEAKGWVDSFGRLTSRGRIQARTAQSFLGLPIVYRGEI